MKWLIKTLLFTFSFSLSADQIYYGTPPRLERESKFATLVTNADLKKIGKEIQAKLNKLIHSKNLKFDKSVYSEYRTDLDFQTFVFQDTYLDTEDFDLANLKSAYRLRYRWTFVEKFISYELFPFFSPFYPDRCEIQFKSNYRVNGDVIEVDETRFEFRKESEPFLSGYPVPPPPWPRPEYLDYAISGHFKKIQILPFQQFKKLKLKGQLKPIVQTTTKRHRLHVMTPNPWGSGPNPDHVFIITIDLVNFKDLLTQKDFPQKILELEIEIDRNTSTLVDKIAEQPQSGFYEDASVFSKKAYNLLREDQLLIRAAIHEELETHFTALPLKSKYQRMLEMLAYFKT